MAEKIENPLVDRLNKAIKDPNLIKIYANGFVNGVGQGDVMVLLMQNDEAVAMLNMSYTVAKTLVIKLGAAIRDLEEKTGNNIMTTDEVDKKMSSNKIPTKE